MTPDDKSNLIALGMIIGILAITAYTVWQVAR
jgi:hypothetical protein